MFRVILSTCNYFAIIFVYAKLEYVTSKLIGRFVSDFCTKVYIYRF